MPALPLEIESRVLRSYRNQPLRLSTDRGQMKILTTYEAKNDFPRVLKLSRKDVVIVTNRGKPVAAIEGLKGEDDLKDHFLERSPKFWDMIHRARKRKGLSLDQVRKRLSLPKDLAISEMDRESVKSTSVASVGYNELSGTLEIEYRNGSLYRYYDVPEQVYTDLMAASSLGRFINKKIKPYFTYKKIA
jgi:antitoxin (DNA-binding transcriptional repressor) of toxin-antitoxin stability system